MESLVKAAVIVLNDAQGSSNRETDQQDDLERDVSLFLRSMRHFRDQPLPFPTATYRDFFVLVAQWRHEELAIDARYTIDSTRSWIELSSASERRALDQDLGVHSGAWDGPYELTSRLLTMLMVLHTDGETCVKEVDNVAHLLFDSLKRAAESAGAGSTQLLDILFLLGILLDAFAELTKAGNEDQTDLIRSIASLLVITVWRDHERAKIAVGFLNRIVARDASFKGKLAANTASAIVSLLSLEADCPYAGVDVKNAGPLMFVAAIFRNCLGVMLESAYADAIECIASALFEPLSHLLRRLIERTREAPADEHTTELEMVATTLYDTCDKALRGQPPEVERGA
ncbi:hypothetical protein EX895_006427 [Sporisorium graminicola]|uniref:Uncharacterized protein n=1 Tax=Sporisorium graminicola TaxID=280036 RepID=A0A4U7KKC4_9BASI|nr:hypothetical protein EX895_006427 [Sporisorium graminicola]TKY84525.1 hypothetical protein EX895_006427 [Sporisorium graminicola]